jgi:CRP-like cAMP-binding protein
MSDADAILALCRTLSVTSLDPGTVLLDEGARSGNLFVLIDGELEILKGEFQINVVAAPGAIFGEVSALLDIPHMATVRALTRASVYKIADAAAFLNANPAVAIEVARLLAQRLNGVTSYLVDLKRQFEDQESHLGMVDEVLETLVHQQRESFTPGSDRDPDPTI